MYLSLSYKFKNSEFVSDLIVIMYDQIKSQIQEVTAYLHLTEVIIDNLIFKLHYVAR